jgi:gluconokinase
MVFSIVVMGVAGCGKSSLASAVAEAQGLTLVEGDDFHSPASRHKMAQGMALTDEDREGWLGVLGEQLRAHPEGIVLTCSALKQIYRNRLRAASPGLRFVFLNITREESLARVAGRGPGHFFPSNLVDSQFAALESPVGEPGVLRIEATAPLAQLQATVSHWLQGAELA